MSLATKTHYKLGVTKSDIKYIIGQQTDLEHNQVKDLIIDILEQTLDLTIADLEEWIDSKVAKRTGKLRDDLKLELNSSFVRDTLLSLKLGTHIEYAKFVAEMSTAMVRHSGEVGTAYYGGVSGDIMLNDPQAIGNFFVKLIKFAKERLEINFAKAKAMYLGGAGKAGKLISSKFKWGK